MTRQTSMNLTPATEAQLDYLKQRGFGGTTGIVRVAIDRMAQQEGYRRGEYGISIRGGHSAGDDPDALAIFAPDFGDFVWSSIDAAIESGEWVEISGEEHANL